MTDYVRVVFKGWASVERAMKSEIKVDKVKHLWHELPDLHYAQIISTPVSAAPAVAQSVKHPELKSLKEVHRSQREFDSQSHLMS